jgi:L-aminopeptidase/D-esterase-like protein
LNDTLTDVQGLAVGHFTHADRATGCTVVLCPQGAVAGVEVRGGAPGTRETDLLRPENTVDRVHALLLSGGSAFGLDAAGGVMRWLEENGHGFAVGAVRVAGITVAALVVVNATGDVIDTGSGEPIAGARKSAASRQLFHATRALLRGDLPPHLQPGAATTIGVVATDAALDKAQCTKLASMAHDGLARSISPIHTPYDGDTMFALATGATPSTTGVTSTIGAPLGLLGVLAADVTARAVRHAVEHARSRTGCPALRDLAGAV